MMISTVVAVVVVVVVVVVVGADICGLYTLNFKEFSVAFLSYYVRLFPVCALRSVPIGPLWTLSHLLISSCFVFSAPTFPLSRSLCATICGKCVSVLDMCLFRNACMYCTYVRMYVCVCVCLSLTLYVLRL